MFPWGFCRKLGKLFNQFFLSTLTGTSDPQSSYLCPMQKLQDMKSMQVLKTVSFSAERVALGIIKSNLLSNAESFLCGPW
jgi:hypothetical protein